MKLKDLPAWAVIVIFAVLVAFAIVGTSISSTHPAASIVCSCIGFIGIIVFLIMGAVETKKNRSDNDDDDGDDDDE